MLLVNAIPLKRISNVHNFVIVILWTSSRLPSDLDGELLEILVIRNILVYGRLDDIGGLLAVLLDPFIIHLRITFDGVLLQASQHLVWQLLQLTVADGKLT